MRTHLHFSIPQSTPHPPAHPTDVSSSSDADGDGAGGGDASDADADAAGAAGSGAPPPMELNVAANGNPGVYLVERRAVRCLCAACLEARRAHPGAAAHVISPTEFERHSGIPAAKKWRFSIKVAHAGEPEICLGRWLELRGLDQKVPKRVIGAPHGGALSPAHRAAAQRGAAAAAAAAVAAAAHHSGGAPATRHGGAARARAAGEQSEAEAREACLGLELLSCGAADGIVHLARVPAAAGAAGAGKGAQCEWPLHSARQSEAGDCHPPAGDHRGSPRHQARRRSSNGAAVAAAAAAAARAGAAARAAGRAPPPPQALSARVSSGDARASDDDEDGEDPAIRVGPEFQAALPAWRPGPPPASPRALARAGARGPPEARAAEIAVEERARAARMHRDAVDDDVWEQEDGAGGAGSGFDAAGGADDGDEPARERGRRHRRAPGWLDEYAAGGAAAAAVAGAVHARGGGAHGAGGGDDEAHGGHSSDHGGAAGAVGGRAAHGARRKRVSTASAHSGSCFPLPHSTAAALLLPAQQQHAQQPPPLFQSQRAAGAAGAAAPGGPLPPELRGSLAAAAAAAANAPNVVEWRVQDNGRGDLEIAVLLGGQVYVGRLAPRGPLLHWLPPAAAAAAAGAGAAPAGSAAHAHAHAYALAHAHAAAAAGVKPEPHAAGATAAATAAAAAASVGDAARRACALCAGGEPTALGPLMPVQVVSGVLHWVHRDCALWSPEVAVDAAGRLGSLPAAVRRGLETPCAACGRRGATLACWRADQCGREMHLPCARRMGCRLVEGGAAGGAPRLVACPAHDPPPALTAAEAVADADSAGGAPVMMGGAHGAESEMEAAAELLTDIRRSSWAGDSGGGAAAGAAGGFAQHHHGAASAAAAAAQQRLMHHHNQAPKRRRSTSADAASDGTREALSGDDDAAGGGSGGGWAGGHKRRAPGPSLLQPLPAAGADADDGDEASLSPLRAALLVGSGAAALLGATADGAGAESPTATELAALLRAAAANDASIHDLLVDAAAVGTGAGGTAQFGGTAGHGGRPGRCAVCVVQRKGRCGTDSAPRRCLRRQAALAEAAALEARLMAHLEASAAQTPSHALLLEALRTAAPPSPSSGATAGAAAAAAAAAGPGAAAGADGAQDSAGVPLPPLAPAPPLATPLEAAAAPLEQAA